MLDTGSGPNTHTHTHTHTIKKNFISRDITVNHNNMLKLNNRINEYPVHILSEITF